MMEIPGDTGGQAAGRRLGACLAPVILAGLAGILWLDPWPYASPVEPPVEVPSWAVDPTPVRTPLLKPETEVSVYRYRCSECHALMPSPPETDRPLTQHRHIRLEHGINDRCFNCHLRGDRDFFADDRGERIPYDQPQLLCSKCHGPVYRDWTHGVHGRTNGHWSPAFGHVVRRKCIECHDPHAPAFEPMRPAPGPRTLRMGPQGGPEEHPEETRNPLLIYRREGALLEPPRREGSPQGAPPGE